MSDEQLRADELVSAYLDGEATPAEIAEVEASDALLARVEELRAVRDAVAEPVTSLPADLQDDLIGAALGVADAEAAARLEAKVVPFRRPQRLLLAMAAAVILLAAVVGTGLIASRGGDEYADTAATAADAPAAAEMAPEAMADAGPSDDMAMAEEEPAPAEAPEEEPMAGMDMTTADEAMAEEPMADVEPMEEAEPEAPMVAEATTTIAAATTAPAATTTIAAAAADESDGAPPEQVVDLGTFESLEALLADVGASWSAALDDGATADSAGCATAVHERALELSTDEPRSFVATVGSEDPATFDGRFVRRDDGTAVIVYAAPPGCEISIHELLDS